ncbi:MAG: hypothetical protein GXW85_04080, partial [Clostridia bacterium]|nr:hypothetical protein [Clostridia bacterium]
MYYVNKNHVNLVRLSVPMGIALFSGFFLESLAIVKNFSIVFLAAGIIGNMYYPEIIMIEKGKIKLKLTLAKKYTEFPGSDLKISIDKKGRFYILHLDRDYRLD